MRAGIAQEITRMAVESIRSHKLRSFLTLLGIMIGVMTVIAMVSVIQGLNETFLSELESAGSDIIIVSKYEPGIQIGNLSEDERQRKDLTLEDVEALRAQCPAVKAVAVDLSVDLFESVAVKYKNTKTLDTIILGMNSAWPQVLSIYNAQEGRFITEADVAHSAKICVLGAEIHETLFPHINAIGAEKFRVVGILEKRGSMFGQSRDNIIGIPITTLMKHFPYALENLEILAAPVDRSNYEEATEQIINLLRARRKVGFGKPNDFAVFGQDTIIDLYNQLTGAAYMVMVVISSIGLLVGGIGVMNIMLVTVKERTREIGIRKAIGARSGDILKQFLIEAVFLTGFGGVSVVLIGFLIALLVRAVTPLPASVTAWSVVLGVGVSVSVGLFFGIFPARKAAKTDPMVCLRHE